VNVLCCPYCGVINDKVGLVTTNNNNNNNNNNEYIYIEPNRKFSDALVAAINKCFFSIVQKLELLN